jgi:hypothetical protein
MSMTPAEAMNLLLRGSEEAVDEVIESHFGLIVDWRESADEVLALVKEILGADFDYEVLDDDLGRFRLRLADREDEIEMEAYDDAAGDGEGGNGIDLLWPLAEFLEPDYRLFFFRESLGNDTVVAMIQPADWWDEMRKRDPERFASLFADPEEAEELVSEFVDDFGYDEDDDDEDDNYYGDDEEE